MNGEQPFIFKDKTNYSFLYPSFNKWLHFIFFIFESLNIQDEYSFFSKS